MDQSRYEKGDRVWVLWGYGSRRPGVVIGYYVDWDLYKIVHMVDTMGRDQWVVEKWRLTLRKKGEKHYIPK